VESQSKPWGSEKAISRDLLKNKAKSKVHLLLPSMAVGLEVAQAESKLPASCPPPKGETQGSCSLKLSEVIRAPHPALHPYTCGMPAPQPFPREPHGPGPIL
jgi:hypothetical protein